MFPVLIWVPNYIFRKTFRASRLPKCFIFVKKNFIGCRDFYFLPSSKILIWKKVRSLFSRSKFFKKVQKIFENLENFQWKINENRKSQKFWKSKISIFIDFSLKKIQIFENFLNDFWKIWLSKKWPNFFSDQNFWTW